MQKFPDFSLIFGQISNSLTFPGSPGFPGCVATLGWLMRFKQRYGILQITVQGEKLSNDKSASENSDLEFQKFACEENLIVDLIYNAEEKS